MWQRWTFQSAGAPIHIDWGQEFSLDPLIPAVTDTVLTLVDTSGQTPLASAYKIQKKKSQGKKKGAV